MMAFGLDWDTAYATLRPLAIFLAGMVIYGIFIFKFYRFLAKRDIFEHDLTQYNNIEHDFWSKFFDHVLNLIKYILIFPAITFFWFGVLSVLIIILSSEQSFENILMISMALVGAVRVTSYYSEDLSRDMAKTLPFVLLGVFLLDFSSVLAITDGWVMIKDITNHWVSLLYYLGFIIALEFLLRIWEAIRGPSTHNKDDCEPPEIIVN